MFLSRLFKSSVKARREIRYEFHNNVRSFIYHLLKGGDDRKPFDGRTPIPEYYFGVKIELDLNAFG